MEKRGDFYDVINNGDLENIEDGTMFKKVIPDKIVDGVVKELANWSIEIIENNVEVMIENEYRKVYQWISLVGLHNNRLIRTSAIVGVKNPFLIKTRNCFYKLLERNPLDNSNLLKDGFVDKWEVEIYNFISAKEIIKSDDESKLNIIRINEPNKTVNLDQMLNETHKTEELNESAKRDSVTNKSNKALLIKNMMKEIKEVINVSKNDVIEKTVKENSPKKMKKTNKVDILSIFGDTSSKNPKMKVKPVKTKKLFSTRLIKDLPDKSVKSKEENTIQENFIKNVEDKNLRNLKDKNEALNVSLPKDNVNEVKLEEISNKSINSQNKEDEKIVVNNNLIDLNSNNEIVISDKIQTSNENLIVNESKETNNQTKKEELLGDIIDGNNNSMGLINNEIEIIEDDIEKIQKDLKSDVVEKNNVNDSLKNDSLFILSKNIQKKKKANEEEEFLNIGFRRRSVIQNDENKELSNSEENKETCKCCIERDTSIPPTMKKRDSLTFKGLNQTISIEIKPKKGIKKNKTQKLLIYKNKKK
ncbi:hypothetical protein A0H76_284 [Hepatospora eriocheir]|uniref:Uncharacterized protein n=1 Tax=Hepatospora eriocheir TaxID=1081669 RepID=A0A1X0QIY8_9MICR|nr:hypothetical protein A0H76_284 [Hepatospora eriocheir]